MVCVTPRLMQRRQVGSGAYRSVEREIELHTVQHGSTADYGFYTGRILGGPQLVSAVFRTAAQGSQDRRLKKKEHGLS